MMGGMGGGQQCSQGQQSQQSQQGEGQCDIGHLMTKDCAKKTMPPIPSVVVGGVEMPVSSNYKQYASSCEKLRAESGQNGCN